jgi:hypothetical protein
VAGGETAAEEDWESAEAAVAVDNFRLERLLLADGGASVMIMWRDGPARLLSYGKPYGWYG